MTDPLSPDEAVAILHEAEAAFEAGRLGPARAGFERVLASGHLTGWAQFFLGRVWRDLGRPDQARAAFSGAIAAEPGLFWAHYERLMLAVRAGADDPDLAVLADAIAATEWQPLAAPHVRGIEEAAHMLWDAGHKRPAIELLRRLWPAEALGALALARIVEGSPTSVAGEEAARRLRAMPEPDAAALLENGDLPGNATLLERRYALAPDDLATWMALVRATAARGDGARVEALLAGGTRFSARQRSFVHLLATVELRQAETAFLALRSHCRLWAEVPRTIGIRTAYLLSDAFRTDARDEVIALLRIVHGADTDVRLLEVNAAMRDQRWAAALALWDQYFATLTDPPHSVRVARADVLAFAGRLPEAAALLEAERVEGEVQPAFLRSTLRVLAERGQWDAVLDAGLPHVGRDPSFEHVLSVLVRAARSSCRGEELCAALLALPRPLGAGQRDALWAIAEDLIEGGTDVLPRLAGLDVPVERRRRWQSKTQLMESGARDLCIYFCADGPYLTPALVALAALASSNARLVGRVDFRLVIEAERAASTRSAAAALATRLGIALEVVDASAIVGGVDRLRTAYGMFTGGQQLSLAAYYRIFFARHLVGTEYAQALYLDADTLIRGGLAELFDLPMTEPLMARPETDRPEVRHASALHDLKGRYFNSGVLRFDLRHPALPAALERAIAAAIDPAVPLVFQDQCALNIGFDGQVAELPARFNHFAPPARAGDAETADAVVLHYLDRPKPWDSLYRGDARTWFEWFDLVRTVTETA